MAKARTTFVCQQCGAQFAKWVGRCNDCGEWDSVVEEAVAPRPTAGSQRTSIAIGAARDAKPVPLASVAPQTASRVSTGLVELDRVLGGGIVAGSAILLGGDPGIGKSTISLQVLGELGRRGMKALYVSGEESP
ncbi:MAG: ATPase domain-containing protein, partial [Alphaproteobacteria bacterium]